MRRIVTGAVAIGVAGVLAACGTPPWELPNADGSGPLGATPTPTPTPSAIEVITNDLATGSTRRELTAGDITLTVDYWSTLDMGEWNAGANKPVSLAMVAELGTDDGQKVYLDAVNVDVEVDGPNGASLPSPAPLMDKASVSPGYFIKDPYSYSQTFVLPAVDASAKAVKLTFTYELLQQTTPRSKQYSKQTASDTLTIAIAQPAG
jgi:hypothetical protein